MVATGEATAVMEAETGETAVVMVEVMVAEMAEVTSFQRITYSLWL